MSETSNFYTKVTQPVANIVTNLIFAFCAVASRLLVLGLICVQISLCVSVNVDGLTSPSIRNASPGLEWFEWLGCTAAVIQKKGSERRTAVWILQATKFISLYTACNSQCTYYEHEHKQSGHIGRCDILQRSSQPLLATFALLAIAAVTTSV